MNELIHAPTGQVLSNTAETEKAFIGYIEASKSKNTRIAIASDIKQFEQWANGATPSLSLIARYITEKAELGYKKSTLQRFKSNLMQAYQLQATIEQQAIFKALLNGIGATNGTAKKQAKAVSKKELLMMIKCLDLGTIAGLRNKAMLELGWACALRRSELVALTVGDIEHCENDGEAFIIIKKSKTDQQKQGVRIPLKQSEKQGTIKPLNTIKQLIHLGGLGATDKLFDITPTQCYRIITDLAKKAGLNGVSGHSLRAGFITEAFKNGVGIDKIKQVSRHKNIDVLMMYERDTELMKNPASLKVL